MKRRVSTMATEKEELMDKYIDKMADTMQKIFPPTPQIDWSQIPKPEPLVFTRDGTNDAALLVAELLDVLNGYSIEVIVTASNVVEQYVKAQSRGQIFTYPSIVGR